MHSAVTSFRHVFGCRKLDSVLRATISSDSRATSRCVCHADSGPMPARACMDSRQLRATSGKPYRHSAGLSPVLQVRTSERRPFASTQSRVKLASRSHYSFRHKASRAPRRYHRSMLPRLPDACAPRCRCWCDRGTSCGCEANATGRSGDDDTLLCNGLECACHTLKECPSKAQVVRHAAPLLRSAQAKRTGAGRRSLDAML